MGAVNHRLAVIKLPDETLEPRGFKRHSLPSHYVHQVGQSRWKTTNTFLKFFAWGKATIIFNFVCVKISNPAHKSDLSLDLSRPPLPHGDVLKIILRYEWQKGLHAWHFKLNADTTPVTWAAQAQTSSQPTVSTTHHSETSLVTERRHWDVKITVWDIYIYDIFLEATQENQCN